MVQYFSNIWRKALPSFYSSLLRVDYGQTRNIFSLGHQKAQMKHTFLNRQRNKPSCRQQIEPVWIEPLYYIKSLFNVENTKKRSANFLYQNVSYYEKGIKQLPERWENIIILMIKNHYFLKVNEKRKLLNSILERKKRWLLLERRRSC